jgi:hypothetical protein
MKYAVELGSSAMIYIYIKIVSAIQKFGGVTQTTDSMESHKPTSIFFK